MLESFVSAVVLLLLVLDPIGNMLPFHQLTAQLPPKRRRFVILRECLIGLGVLLAFVVAGTHVLKYTGVNTGTLKITGGVLLFIIGLKMLFQGESGMEQRREDETVPREPYLVPLAVPLFAGPSAITLAVVKAGPDAPDRAMWIAGMVVAGLIATTILYFTEPVLAKLGEVTVAAFGRLMGLALTAIALQLILDGTGTYLLDLWRQVPKN